MVRLRKERNTGPAVMPAVAIHSPGTHRAGFWIAAVGDAHLAPLALLIGFRLADKDRQAVVSVCHIGEVERRLFNFYLYRPIYDAGNVWRKSIIINSIGRYRCN
jgi:hypothetical protein